MNSNVCNEWRGITTIAAVQTREGCVSPGLIWQQCHFAAESTPMQRYMTLPCTRLCRPALSCQTMNMVQRAARPSQCVIIAFRNVIERHDNTSSTHEAFVRSSAAVRQILVSSRL